MCRIMEIHVLEIHGFIVSSRKKQGAIQHRIGLANNASGVVFAIYLISVHLRTDLRTDLRNIREDPGSFREEKREGGNRLSKNPQSGKIREVSRKRNGERREHRKSRFCSVSIRSPAPDVPNPEHVSTS
jgi:hypothetical protein